MTFCKGFNMRNSFAFIVQWFAALIFVTFIFAENLYAGAECFPGQVAPQDGTTIPANAPGLGIQSAFEEGQQEYVGFDAGLFSENGDEIALKEHEVDDGFNYLVPETDLIAGETYRLVYEEPCANYWVNSGEDPIQGQNQFKVIEDVPLPDEFGELSIEDLGVENIYPNQWGCEGPSGLAHVMKVKINPSNNLKAFLPVTKFCLHEEGELIKCDNYDGSIYHDYEKSPMEERYFFIYQVCPREMQRCGPQDFCLYPNRVSNVNNDVKVTISARIAGHDTAIVSDEIIVPLTNCGYSSP